jgi:hypothetical protein
MPLATVLGMTHSSDELYDNAAADRQIRARIAANTRWSREPDRSAATAAGRAGLEAKFVREVDPNGQLSPQDLAVRVEAARRAHFLRMALKSAKARRKRRAAPGGGVASGGDAA